MAPRILKIAFFAMGLLLIAIVPASAASVPPSIESESVSGISSTNAILKATINAESGDGAYYQFQLAEDPSDFPEEMQCPPPEEGQSLICVGPHSSSALPLRLIGGETHVELDLSEAGVTLNPGTIYHYRVLAANKVFAEDTIEWEEPAVFGPDQTFTASDSNSAPTVEAQSIANLISTDATLKATINPGGLETTYEFLLWESPCGPMCEVIVDISLPSETIPASLVGEEVSLDLNSAGVTLTPGAEYGYSVRASNSEGTDEGEWEIFYAPIEGAPTITGESASQAKTDRGGPDAILEANILPGDSEAGTYYQFQVGEEPSEFADEIECPPLSGGTFIPCVGNESPAALPIRWIAKEAGETTVQLRLSDFFEVKPSTTYYFRVLAANAKPTEDTLEWEEPTVFSPTKSIKTQDQVSPPKEEGSSGAGGCSPGTCPGPNPGRGGSGVTCKKGQVKRHGVCVKKHRACRRKGHHAKRCHRKSRLH